MIIKQLLIVWALAASGLQAGEPPAGFKAIFNGKDLEGWRGGETYDHRKLLALPEEERNAQIERWTKTLTEVGEDGTTPHWRVGNEELINDGHGAYATTEEDYGDFELQLEYKTVPKADSGIYLRGVPQVQIWDFTQDGERARGSGGLWNNSPGAPGKDPLVKADKPFGEWNHLRIRMVGTRVSVWLNQQLVVDDVVMENYYDRKVPVPERGPIQLQTHGGEIRWRNIFLKELPPGSSTKADV